MTQARQNAIDTIINQLDDLRMTLEQYSTDERIDAIRAARELGGIDAELPDMTYSDALADAGEAIGRAIDRLQTM